MPVSVSIIIPVYNAEKTVARCVQSLVNQTCNALELILVDDGSTDQSPAICDSLAEQDARIQVLHTANAGPAAARNAGLDKARGAYIGFADADDWAEPGMFAALYAHAQKTAADVVVCDYWADQPNHSAVCKPFPGESRLFSAEAIRAHILPYFFGYAPEELSSFMKHCPFADTRSYVWCCLYRASLLKDNHLLFPDEKQFYTEDNLFNLLAVFHASRLAYLAQPLYHYVEQTSTFTRHFQPAYLDCRLRKYAYLTTFAIQNGLQKQVKERLSRKICAEVPTLLNYYAANAPSFSEKVRFARRILREPSITEALSAVPSSEWPGGRLGTTLGFAKRKQALPIILACLAQKAIRTHKKQENHG